MINPDFYFSFTGKNKSLLFTLSIEIFLISNYKMTVLDYISKMVIIKL